MKLKLSMTKDEALWLVSALKDVRANNRKAYHSVLEQYEKSGLKCEYSEKDFYIPLCNSMIERIEEIL